MEDSNMSKVDSLIKKCRELGATFIPSEDRLDVEAPQPLPDEVVRELIEAKAQIMAQLSWERRHDYQCWALEEWRRVSMPDWRKILKESVDARDIRREEYARWMLREVLFDPQYQENGR
jgi:hypothetical protein